MDRPQLANALFARKGQATPSAVCVGQPKPRIFSARRLISLPAWLSECALDQSESEGSAPVEAHLRTAIQRIRARKKEAHRSLTFRIDEALHMRSEAVAGTNGWDLEKLMIRALESYLALTDPGAALAQAAPTDTGGNAERALAAKPATRGRATSLKNFGTQR